MSTGDTLESTLFHEVKADIRIPYALHRVPESVVLELLPCPIFPQAGDIALARVEKIGKNATLELANGRRCTLHEGDLIAATYANRYATLQFEAYARARGEYCDLLSMGGLCGVVESKHAAVAEPTKLKLLGALGDAKREPLRLRDFALKPVPSPNQPHIVAVCGTSMDAGKTYTATSLITGLRKSGGRVAGVKLTGSAAGRDTWSMLDAGACVALDFVDGGFPSTYLCTLDELLNLHSLLMGHAASQNADWIVMEIADGLLQKETAALLQSARFTRTIDAWVFAAGDPLGAAGGVCLLRRSGIEPIALSGLVTLSPLAIQEVRDATGLPCFTAGELQRGDLNALLKEIADHTVGVSARATTPSR